jgi:gliding motility-associated-like protein
MRLGLLLTLILISFVGRTCDTDVVIQEGPAISFCYGSPTVLHASPGFVSYSWTGPQNSSNMNFSPNQSGEYVVSATDGLGCVSTDTIQVTIFPVQNAVILSSEGNTICSGSSGTMLSVSGAFTTFSWSTGSTQAVILITSGGAYSVSATDANGCTSNASIFINEPEFEISVSNDLICTGGFSTLTASDGTSYLWSNGSATPSITVNPTTTTTYTVQVTNNQCSGTISGTIEVVDIPISYVEDTFLIAAGDVIFMNGPAGFDQYNWTPATDLTLTNTQGSTFIGSNNSTYVLTSIHNAGCTRVDTFTVIVLALNAPNGFSPNGDQINDTFVIPEFNQYDGSILIWNRWGEIVFESENYQNNWDGTCQAGTCIGNGDLPEGTYFYKVEIEQLEFSGFTTIKR